MAKKRVAVTDEGFVLFDTAVFSSKNPIGGSTDSAWDDGSAFPEISSKKIWAVGDRVTTSHPLCKGKVYTIGVYPSVYTSGEITYEWIETTCNLVLKCDSLTSAQELEPSKNLLTGIINTSEEILENVESNLSELRQGIHFVQSQPEVLQQGLQVPERESRHQYRGSDRNVRVRDDSSESGGTLWGEAENNLEVVQGSGVQIQNCAEHEGQHGKTSKRKAKQQLEGRNHDDERLHLSKMPQSSQSKRTRQVYSAAHSSNGKISGEISGILRPGTPKQRGSSPYQSQQAGQPDREPSVDETLRTRKDPQQREQAQVEQSSEEEGHRKNLCISSRSLTEPWNERPSSGNCNQDKHESRRNTLGICQQLNLQLWIYALGWEVVFLLQCCGLEDLISSEPQRLTNTAQASSNCDIPAYTTTATCEISQDLQDKDLCTQEESISSQLPHPAPRSLQKANDLEVQMKETVSPPSSKPLENYSQGSQPLKMSQDLSPAPITQDNPQAHISEAWSVPLTSSGTMRNGLLSAQDTLPAPTLEKDYCWLRSPGALSLSGKGRPPGQTKQEAELKKLGLINKGEVLNPAILCQWYEIPDSWLDPLECRAATELLENSEQQQEIFSILESQRSRLTESSTSTHYAENQPLVKANAQQGTYIINQSESLGIIKNNLGFGFVIEWLSSSDQITYNWERDDQQIIGLAIAPQSLINKFLEDNQPQLCTKCFKVVERNYTCDRCSPIQCTQQSNHVNCPGCESPLIKLDDGCGVCGWIPENFLEETESAAASTSISKRRQRKGCLYKYIENKKLKNGTIASYPRVIGHRNPDNPTHWRWGFNWEEKVDGEWKGRSIGSVPIGAIALIQSMQNEGVPLEEIIGFIRRAKSKKC